MYRQVTIEQIEQTLNTLTRRIDERFKGSGLAKISHELEQICAESQRKLEWIARPNYWLRAAITIAIGIGIGLVGYSLSQLSFSLANLKINELVAVSESITNELLLIGAALFFLFSLEARLKRARALATINELRALAHLVDMHQLTKDPTEIGTKTRTASSPKRSKTPYELSRYLDYCTELLSLIGKLAAIYAQHFPEAELVSAANDVENLANGLSRKIWQKIHVLQVHHGKQLIEAAQQIN